MATRSPPFLVAAMAGVGLSIAAAVGAETGTVGEGWPEVTIAVRVDAMPFAWQDTRPKRQVENGAPTHEIYRGFLVDMCVRAALHAKFKPNLIGITADERKQFLRLNDPQEEHYKEERVELEVPAFDVLCDPTTISLSRMYSIQQDETFVFSPILFVANSSFVSPNWTALDAAKELGKWPTTPAATVITPAPAPADADEAEPAAVEVEVESTIETATDLARCVDGTRSKIAGFVTGTTAEEAVQAAVDLEKITWPEGAKCARAFESHRLGMDAVCSGEIGYYFGDLDIISAYEIEISSEPERSCDLVYTRDFLIYEPYAVLVGRGAEGSGFRQKFIRELYRLFSDGTVEDTFEAYFTDRPRSDALSMLFRINGIPFGALPELKPEAVGPAGAEPAEDPAPGPDTVGSVNIQK